MPLHYNDIYYDVKDHQICNQETTFFPFDHVFLFMNFVFKSVFFPKHVRRIN